MSHRHRLKRDTSTVHASTTGSGPQIAYQSRPLADKMAVQSHRYSTTSVAPSETFSISSAEHAPLTRTSRPSAIPRSTSTTSRARLQALAASRAAPTQPVRVPSSFPPTMTGMSSPPENEWFFRGRRPAPQQRSLRQNPDRASHTRPVSTLDSDADSFLGVAFPENRPQPHLANLPIRLIPELRALATSSHPPALTSSSLSTISSHSTPFSDSPGPRSASTATTATSWSSASPCIMKSTRSPAHGRRANTVPVPSVSRSNVPSLPLPKESLFVNTSSSGTGPGVEVRTPVERTRKKTNPSSPAPTPPPRSSSIKRGRSRSNSKGEVRQPQKIDNLPPPLPDETHDSPLAAYSTHYAAMRRPSRPQEIQNHHDNLQNAINAPSAPGTALSANNDDATQYVKHAPAINTDSGESKRLLEAATIVSGGQDVAAVSTQSARNRLAKFSRIALFGRAAKDDSETQHKAPPRKLQRKGPAAGTGYEGYGKQARRSRKTSAESARAETDSEGFLSDATTQSAHSRRRQSNSHSVRPSRPSQSDLDDFAATRMKPVVILGGSRRSDAQSRTTFGYSSATDAHGNASHDPLSIDDVTVQGQPAPASDPLISKPWTSSSYSTLTDRSASTQLTYHSMNDPRTSVASDHENATVPSLRAPLNQSWNTSQSSVAPSIVAPETFGSDLHRVDTRLLEQQKSKFRKLKWNIFRRKDTETEPPARVPERPKRPDSLGLAVEISSLADSKTVPYYAMLDSESDTQAVQAVGEFLTEAAHFLYADDEEDSPNMSTHERQQTQRVQSVLLPSAPHISGETSLVKSDPVSLQDKIKSATLQEADRHENFKRRPRLAQVGRIPMVISNESSRREFKSFSRPFNQGTPSKSKDDAGPPLQVAVAVADSPSASGYTSEFSERRPGNLAYGFPIPASNRTHQGYASPPENFSGVEPLHFGDRQSITSSSSEGMNSVMGPPLIPLPEHRRQKSNPFMLEDDIWNEYDDFIDHVTTPIHSPEGQYGPPTPTAARSLQTIPDYTGSDAPSLPVLAKGLAIDTSYGSVPTIYASPELLQESDAFREVRLRRSRIISALHSSIDPASPFSVADYFSEQSEKLATGDIPSRRLSPSTPNNDATVSPRLLGPSIALPEIPQSQHHESVTQMNDVQRSRDPAKHAELSYASLMVSRWLSFGQVLFSPAHTEIQKQPGRHVLVIDGLGNEDWAMYCAVTYQAEQAYIYDLKESSSLRGSSMPNTSENMPPNLRRREVADFYEPLKFPDNYFSAIVIRFPPVMAETKLKSIISECRRVLAPGGHIELMLLDLDLVNMGVVTRRALRELKTNITLSNPDVSLKPVIDNVQSVLCEKGFSKLSRCVVGVPVVGRPPASVDSPLSSRSSGESERYKFGPAGPRPLDGLHEHGASNFSLNELVADYSDNADAKISKTVSRTARSWWQHCFEASVISDGNLAQSILSNKRVLSECKSRSSSFRLLIAYAQKSSKPTIQMKRRTMSEPVISTLVTS